MVILLLGLVILVAVPWDSRVVWDLCTFVALLGAASKIIDGRWVTGLLFTLVAGQCLLLGAAGWHGCRPGDDR